VEGALDRWLGGWGRWWRQLPLRRHPTAGREVLSPSRCQRSREAVMYSSAHTCSTNKAKFVQRLSGTKPTTVQILYLCMLQICPSRTAVDVHGSYTLHPVTVASIHHIVPAPAAQDHASTLVETSLQCNLYYIYVWSKH
jgi:hypothetical protein